MLISILNFSILTCLLQKRSLFTLFGVLIICCFCYNLNLVSHFNDEAPKYKIQTISGAVKAGAQYRSQVILLLENDKNVIKAGHYLSKEKFTGTFQTVWLKDANHFEQVVWDEVLEKHVPTTTPLPNGEEWLQTRIQIVGHGNHKANKVGGYTGESLVEVVMQLTKHNDVRWINIVACNTKKYMNDVMDALRHHKRFKTSVGISLGSVVVDPCGRIFTGESVKFESDDTIGIKWTFNGFPSIIGSFNGYQSYFSKPQESQIIHYWGILPQSVPIYITPKKSNRHLSGQYKIDDNTALKWIDRISEKLYDQISRTNVTKVHLKYQVYMLAKKVFESLVVIEIYGMDDLLREIYYYGHRGATTEQEVVYYRFGYWVLSMKLNTFYFEVVGIINTGKSSTEIAAYYYWKKWEALSLTYRGMWTSIDKVIFLEDFDNWINGRHDKIALNLKNAYNAQFALAVFLAESIRCFQTHLTNMMAIQLINRGLWNLDYFYRYHPMSRANTWQLKQYTGLKLLKLTFKEYQIQIKKKYEGNIAKKQIDRKMVAFLNTKALISMIFKAWLSRCLLQTFSGSSKLHPNLEIYQNPSPTLLTPFMDCIIEVLKNPRSTDHLRPYGLKTASDPLFIDSETVNNKLDAPVANGTIHSVLSMLEMQTINMHMCTKETQVDDRKRTPKVSSIL